jgi:hypothetical protein
MCLCNERRALVREKERKNVGDLTVEEVDVGTQR